ncbi:DUF4302 domain-containing protein [Rapidithrix thailandica]|uniref:DUF4302 domain-containing protein n=1 Tax=Rapidithrix thailandica TaxID=413964 RepID=A0AAW9RZM5_9BACT
MKQILNHIALGITGLWLFTACENNYEPDFSQEADQRLNVQLTEYQTLLEGAPHGWKAMVKTGTNTGLFYYFDFKEGNEVAMLSDFNNGTATDIQESIWQLKGLQRPTLSFPVYSYVHLPADPKGSVNGGTNGKGLVSDHEFAITRVEGDTVFMEGLLRGSESFMIKATEQEKQAYQNGRIKQMMAHTLTYNEAYPYPYLEQGETSLPLAINEVAKVFSLIITGEEGKLNILSVPFSYSATGIFLWEEVKLNGTSFREIIWDADAEEYYVMAGGTRINFAYSPSPVIVDANPPLYQSIGREYTSVTVDPARLNGLPDAFLDIYNQSAAGLSTVGGLGIIMDYFTLTFDQSDVVTFTIRMHVPSGTVYYSNYKYVKSVDEQGKMTFTLKSMDSNANFIASGVKPLLDYIGGNMFGMQLVAYPRAGSFLAGMYPEGNADTYFFGILE